MRSTVQFRYVVGGVAAAMVLAGCSSSQPMDQAIAVGVNDAWVKATDEDMTAAFMHLTNDGGVDANLISASSPVAGRVEIHEVADDAGFKTMRPKAGGLAIPGHGDLELRPGADHLMLMDLRTELRPGTEVQIAVTFDDGSTLPITAQVREFPGADEHYGPAHHG